MGKSTILQCCFCSVPKSCLTPSDPRDCSTQASPSFTASQSLLKFMSIELIMLSNHLILCCPLLLPSVFPSIRVFISVSQLFTSGGQSIVYCIAPSTSALVIPMNIQGWFLLGLTILISLQSNSFSRVFFRTALWKYQCFGAQPSLWSDSHIWIWLLEKP